MHHVAVLHAKNKNKTVDYLYCWK